MAEDSRSPKRLTEKERTLRELARVQHKCAALKGEIKLLRAASSAKEAATLRKESDKYREVLSTILYRLERGTLNDGLLHEMVVRGLSLRGLRGRDRRAIEQLREAS